jgi:hypothetical protein
MLFYLEKKDKKFEVKINSKEEELLKLKQAVNNMQNKILRQKSDRYNFDFEKDQELTATKKESITNIEPENKKVNEEISLKQKKVFPTGSGKALNIFKERLQSMLGKKSTHNVSAE